MSHEKHVRKQADAHELQQARCLSKLRDGFTEETLQKLDRKISTYFDLILYIFQWINSTLILKELGLSYFSYPLTLAPVIGKKNAQHGLAFQS